MSAWEALQRLSLICVMLLGGSMAIWIAAYLISNGAMHGWYQAQQSIAKRIREKGEEKKL